MSFYTLASPWNLFYWKNSNKLSTDGKSTQHYLHKLAMPRKTKIDIIQRRRISIVVLLIIKTLTPFFHNAMLKRKQDLYLKANDDRWVGTWVMLSKRAILLFVSNSQKSHVTLRYGVTRIWDLPYKNCRFVISKMFG